MLFMNEYEIEDAVRQHADDPVLGPASLTLRNLMDWTNRNSDGWAYWPKPCRAAKNLQALIQKHNPLSLRWGCYEADCAEEYKLALRAIRAFRTRQGADFEIVEPS